MRSGGSAPRVDQHFFGFRSQRGKEWLKTDVARAFMRAYRGLDEEHLRVQGHRCLQGDGGIASQASLLTESSTYGWYKDPP